MKRMYYCDPNKNRECIKTNCFKFDGTCCFTTKPEYQQQEPEKIDPVQAMTALDYLNDRQREEDDGK